MIQNDRELEVTMSQLAGMYKALAALKRERARYSETWFAIMAEGPLDEIRRMEADVAAYSARAEVEAADAELWLRVAGSGLHWPDAPTSILTTFLNTLRKGIQAGAEWLYTGGLSTRPTLALKSACDLRVVAFQTGSVRVGLRLPEEATSPDAVPRAIVQDALGKYLAVAQWAAGGEDHTHLEAAVTDPALRRVLLNEVKRMAPRPRGQVDVVELAGRGQPGAVALSKSVHARIDAAIDVAATERVEKCEGDLREIDLDKLSFTLRNVANAGHEVPCSFDADLLETALEALDRRVEVHGVRKVGGRRGTTAGRLQVTRLVELDVAPTSAN